MVLGFGWDAAASLSAAAAPPAAEPAAPAAPRLRRPRAAQPFPAMPERRYEANASRHVVSTAEVLAGLGEPNAVAFHRRLSAALRHRPLTSLDYALGGRLEREFNRLAVGCDFTNRDAWLHYAHGLHQMEAVPSAARQIAQQLLAWLPPPVQSSPLARQHGPSARIDEQMEFAEQQQQQQQQQPGWQQWRAQQPQEAGELEGHPHNCDVCRMKGRAGCWLAGCEDRAQRDSQWADAYRQSLHTASEVHAPPPHPPPPPQAAAGAWTPQRRAPPTLGSADAGIRTPGGRAVAAEAAAARLSQIMGSSSPASRAGPLQAAPPPPPPATTTDASYYYDSTSNILSRIAALTAEDGDPGPVDGMEADLERVIAVELANTGAAGGGGGGSSTMPMVPTPLPRTPPRTPPRPLPKRQQHAASATAGAWGHEGVVAALRRVDEIATELRDSSRAEEKTALGRVDTIAAALAARAEAVAMPLPPSFDAAIGRVMAVAAELGHVANEVGKQGSRGRSGSDPTDPSSAEGSPVAPLDDAVDWVHKPTNSDALACVTGVSPFRGIPRHSEANRGLVGLAGPVRPAAGDRG